MSKTRHEIVIERLAHDNWKYVVKIDRWVIDASGGLPTEQEALRCALLRLATFMKVSLSPKQEPSP